MLNVKDELEKMATSRFKQDMPPPGGYSPLDWAKKIPKKMNGKCVIGAKMVCYYYSVCHG